MIRVDVIRYLLELIRDDDIGGIRDGFKQELFKPHDGCFEKYRDPDIFYATTLEQFKIFIEFGFDLNVFKKDDKNLSQLLIFPYSGGFRYNLEITEYVLQSGVFDIKEISELLEKILENRCENDKRYLNLFLRYCAGRFPCFSFQIHREGVTISHFKVVSHEKTEFEDEDGVIYRIDAYDMIDFCQDGKPYFQSLYTGTSYVYSICAIVMFGAKIKTGKRELCRMLHTFLV